MTYQGDWDIRGRDTETVLIGEITDSIIGADARVRAEHDPTFPVWSMYRVCLAGDMLLFRSLREWVVAFSIAYASTGGVKQSVYSDELACVAGWDALYMLMYARQMQPYTVTADELGVHHKTYKRLRDTIYSRIYFALSDYWPRLIIAYLDVKRDERKCGS